VEKGYSFFLETKDGFIENQSGDGNAKTSCADSRRKWTMVDNETVKCPKCGNAHDVEIRQKIQQTPPDKHPCPKCGGMRIPLAEPKDGERIVVLVDACPFCGYLYYEEKVK
jgi:ssDNA-binding Zn-finger/Zn-ribbon topoisomerase 1